MIFICATHGKSEIVLGSHIQNTPTEPISIYFHLGYLVHNITRSHLARSLQFEHAHYRIHENNVPVRKQFHFQTKYFLRRYFERNSNERKYFEQMVWMFSLQCIQWRVYFVEMLEWLNLELRFFVCGIWVRYLFYISFHFDKLYLKLPSLRTLRN